MGKLTIVIAAMALCVVGLKCLAEEAVAPPAKPEKPAAVPGLPAAEAKVLDKEVLLPFVPKAPKGWKAPKPLATTQRLGPVANTRISQWFTKGAQRVNLILEDLGTNNPYFAMKEPVFAIKEEKTEQGYKKKVMLGKVAAQEVFDKAKKEGFVFTVLEKRIQLYVAGTGMEDNKVVVELAKKVKLEELKKVLKEKSK